MRKILFFLAGLLCFGGCTVNQGVDMAASKLIGQMKYSNADLESIKNSALFYTAENIVFIDKANIQALKSFLSDYKGGENYITVLETPTGKIDVRAYTAKKFFNSNRDIFSDKIFVEVRDAKTKHDFINPSGDQETEDAKEVNKNRLSLLKELINTELVNKGYNVSKDMANAKYILSVYVIADGISEYKPERSSPASHKPQKNTPYAKSGSSIIEKPSKKWAIACEIKIINQNDNAAILEYFATQVSKASFK
jgi:hypothetical protein